MCFCLKFWIPGLLNPKDVPCMTVFVFEQYDSLDENQPSRSRENPVIRIMSSSLADYQGDDDFRKNE